MGFTFTDRHDAALAEILATTTYAETSPTDDTDPDSGLAGLLAALDGVQPHDPGFEDAVKAAIAGIDESGRTDEQARDAKNALQRLLIVNWGLAPALTAGAGWRDQLRIPRGNQERSGRWTFTPWKHLDDIQDLLTGLASNPQSAAGAKAVKDAIAEVDAATEQMGKIDREDFDPADPALKTAAENAANRLERAKIALNGGSLGEAADRVEVAEVEVRAWAETDWSMLNEDTDVGAATEVGGTDIADVQSTDIGTEAPAPAPAPTAVRDYAWGIDPKTGYSLHYGLNDNLRTDKPLTPEQQALVDVMDQAFIDTSSKPPKELFRYLDGKDLQKDLQARARAGGNWSDAGFVSTSSDQSVTEDFDVSGEGVVMRITPSPNAPALDMSQFLTEDDYDQSEWLLPRGTEFRLSLGGKTDDGTPIVNAVVQAKTPAAPAPALVDPDEIDDLIDSVKGTDDRAEYTRRALNAYNDFGDTATVLVSKDGSGNVRGAAGLVEHAPEEIDEDLSLPGYLVIDYVGAVDKGAGADLLRASQQEAVSRNLPLLLEKTTGSADWWDKQPGVVEDPMEVGMGFAGWTVEAMKEILRNPDSLTASGFDNSQLRIPRGNGELSGRWMDSPFKILNDLMRALGETAIEDRPDGYVVEAANAAMDFDPGSSYLAPVWDLLDSANAATREPEVERLIGAAMNKIDVLNDVDWSLFDEDTDLRGKGIADAQDTDIGDSFVDVPDNWTPVWGQDDVWKQVGTDFEIRRENGTFDLYNDGSLLETYDTFDDAVQSIEDMTQDYTVRSEDDDATTIARTQNAIAEFIASDDNGMGTNHALVLDVVQGLTARISESAGEGVTVHATSAEFDGYEIDVQFKFIKEGSGFGTLHRKIRPGDRQVSNEFFQLASSHQGTGFASRLTADLENWYQENGINEIVVHANIDIGGYTWARLGFDIDTDQDYSDIKRYAVEGFLFSGAPKDLPGKEIRDVWRAHQTNLLQGHFSSPEIEPEDLLGITEAFADMGGTDDLSDWEGMLADGEVNEVYEQMMDYYRELLPAEWMYLHDVLEEWANAVASGSDDQPSMYEIAMFGKGTPAEWFDTVKIYTEDGSWETKQLPMWPGKAALLASDWHGIKYLNGDGQW